MSTHKLPLVESSWHLPISSMSEPRLGAGTFFQRGVDLSIRHLQKYIQSAILWFASSPVTRHLPQDRLSYASSNVVGHCDWERDQSSRCAILACSDCAQGKNKRHFEIDQTRVVVLVCRVSRSWRDVPRFQEDVRRSIQVFSRHIQFCNHECRRVVTQNRHFSVTVLPDLCRKGKRLRTDHVAVVEHVPYLVRGAIGPVDLSADVSPIPQSKEAYDGTG